MYKILLIEDDATICEIVSRQLAKWSYQVQSVSDFGKVIESFNEFEPHLVLLDISLPFFNGYHWCKEIRKISQAPIIFISSSNDAMSLVMAINMGGDDFVAKPFDIEVLTAKIQAVLRRTYSFGADMSALSLGGVTLNLGDGVISFQDKKIELTKNEMKILELLFSAKGNIVKRDTVIDKLWENENFIDDNTLTVNITRLRKKLEGYGLAEFIKTKKGVGYWLEVSDDKA